MRVPLSSRAPARLALASAAQRRLGRFSESPALLVVQALALLALTLLVVTRYWHDYPALGVGLLAVAAALALFEVGRARARRWWFLYVGGTFAYTLLRALADETVIPVQVDYPIEVDRAVFLGTDPVVWLQDRLFSPRDTTPLDAFAVGVHWSFFIAPHVLAVAIFTWKRDLFPRYAVVVVGTLYLGLALFFLVPTAPPWLAAQAGELDGVFRVMDFVGGRVDSRTYEDFYRSLGEPNSVAAMPSIHIAVTFAMFLWARSHLPRAAWPLLAYTLLMGLALVYLAEHYAVDLAAGLVCAGLSWAITRRALPLAQAPQPVPDARPAPAPTTCSSH
jgi:membrane-associated phospholipid phosphatase